MDQENAQFADIQDTHAYRRALREKLCAELSAAAYGKEPCHKDNFQRFCSPIGKPKPSLSGFGYIEDDTAYISFRGTCNISNLLADACAFPGRQPARHRGFAGCWRRLEPQVQSWLQAHSPKKVVLTGHSLGGSIAQLAAFDLAPNWAIRAVVAFGAPLLGWRKFAAAYNLCLIESQSNTLAEVTTTYVFKSDLWRFVLQLAGYEPCGEEIVIDEKGYPVRSDPWFYATLATTGKVTEELSGWVDTSTAAQNATAFSPSTQVNFRTQVPSLQLAHLLQLAKPFTPYLFLVFPALMLAALAVIPVAAIAAMMHFLVRDFGYHRVSTRYLPAMTARVNRWVPVAFREKGQTLLEAGDATLALPYLTAALDDVFRDYPGTLSDPVKRHLTWNLRLERAKAFSATGNYAAAIADLTALIDTYPSGDIQIGRVPGYSDDPLLIIRTLQQRAIACSRNRQFSKAMADCRRILTAKPELSYKEFSDRVQVAIRNVGGPLARFIRSKKIYDEADRMKKEKDQAFHREMAPTFEWAHYNLAASALQLLDYETAARAATAAIELDPADAWAYNLRANAYLNCKRRADALADFTRSIELQPTVAGFYWARAMGRVEEVKLVDIHYAPNRALVNNVIAITDLPLIEADLRKTLELNPSHEAARSFLDSMSVTKLQNLDLPPAQPLTGQKN